MRVRRIEQTTLTIFLLAACVMFFAAAYAATAQAQNVSSLPSIPPQQLVPVSPTAPGSLTIPQASEVPVSPTTPGTLPGTQAGPGTAVGTNPITGQPCVGGGASALTGGLSTAPAISDQPGGMGQSTAGLPPDNSIYGLGTTTNPGSC